MLISIRSLWLLLCHAILSWSRFSVPCELICLIEKQYQVYISFVNVHNFEAKLELPLFLFVLFENYVGVHCCFAGLDG